MNLKNYKILLAKEPADGGESENLPGTQGRQIKKGMVTVRNVTAQPIACDGTVLQPRVLGKDGKVVKEAPATEIHEKHLDRLGNWVTKLGVIAFAILMLGLSHASAQQYTANALLVSTNGPVLLNGGTNNIPAASAVTYLAPITATKWGDVGLTISFKLNGAGTLPAIFYLDASGDAINWQSNAVAIPIAANGLAQVTTNLNVSLGNIGYLRLNTGTNNNASALTNLIIKPLLKPSRFGS